MCKLSVDYKEILQQLVAEVKSTHILLAKRISRTITNVYWTIGKTIVEKRMIEGYGTGIVERLSIDLKEEFPSYGFSPRNLWYMKRFYETYRLNEKLQQVVAELPWGHNTLLLDRVKTLDEVSFYASSALEYGWSRNILLNFIKSDAYGNQLLPKQHNFQEALPVHLQQQADEIVKDRYNLAF